jgi:hypothetical protein
MEQLAIKFQDFAELCDEKKYTEALELFEQAEQYAKDNNLSLQPAWHKLRERIKNT